MITELGRKTGFCKRERKMTPMKMVMSLMSCFAGGQGTTLAAVQRSDNALPPAASRRGDLLLADRGYFDRDYLRAVDAHGCARAGALAGAGHANRYACRPPRSPCGPCLRRLQRPARQDPPAPLFHSCR